MTAIDSRELQHAIQLEFDLAAAVGTCAEALIQVVAAVASGDLDHAGWEACHRLDQSASAVWDRLSPVRDASDDRQVVIRKRLADEHGGYSMWNLNEGMAADSRRATELDHQAAAARLLAAMRNVVPAAILEAALARNAER